MINSEICFFRIDGPKVFSEDHFLNDIGFDQVAQECYLKALSEASKETEGAIKSFKQQFSFRLDSSNKKYTCSLVVNLKPIKYIYVSVETFFLNKSLKRRLVEYWMGKLPEKWFLQIDNFEGNSKFYLGDLSLLKRYLLQDDSVKSLDMPKQMVFKDEKCLYDFASR